MKNKMILREFQKEDTREMIDIIRKTWHYDEFCSHKVANKLAKVFLYSCLANQTYTKVAVIDNCPIGIIMGKNIARHKCPFRYRIKQMISIISLLISYEGRQSIHLFRDVDGIDRELLDHCEIDFQGEVSFFAIDENYRGLGIGKNLFESLLYYMKEQNIQQFYLFTDTSCNYGFYEHQGMRREHEKSLTMDIANQKQVMKFFIYSYQI